jgi:hypothetical protein
MRFFHAGLCAAVVLTGQFAATAASASTLEQIGAAQAVIAFCSKVDSKDSKELEKAAKSLLPDMTDARVAAGRNKPEFQKAYQSIDSVLKAIVPADAERLCAAAVHPSSDDRHEPKPAGPVQPEHRR